MQQQKPSEFDYLFKLLLLGDPACGKTWFLKAFDDATTVPFGTYNNYVPSPDFEFKIKTIIDPETDKRVRIQLWDPPSERYHNQTNRRPFSTMRGAHGILVLVDVTNSESLINLKKVWFNSIERYARETVRVLVVASKCDDTLNRQVTSDQILDFIAKNPIVPYAEIPDIQFVETSARNDAIRDEHSAFEAAKMLARTIMKSNLVAEHSTDPPKILLLGDPGSGKTRFYHLFSEEPIRDPNLYKPTAEYCKIVKSTTDPDTRKVVQITLWDSPSETLRLDNIKHYSGWRGSHGIILLVDVTKRESLDILPLWFSTIDRYAAMNTVVLIVAPKHDQNAPTQVWNEQILDFVGEIRQNDAHKDRDVQFMNIDAMDNHKILETVHRISKTLVMRTHPKEHKEKDRCAVM